MSASICERLAAWLCPKSPPPQADTDARAPVALPRDLPERTQTSIRRLVWLGIFALASLAIYGLSLRGQGGAAHFLTWAYVAAFCALMFGIIVGLLFGLPTFKVIQIRPATVTPTPTPTSSPTPTPTPAPLPNAIGANAGGANPPAPAPAPANNQPHDGADLPYSDSTSLEQIADWLTKIIVGLSLTQYNLWAASFDRLATGLTVTLFNRGGSVQLCVGKVQAALLAKNSRLPVPEALDAANIACGARAGGPVPGGIILAGFAFLGFLIAYLWMRRYFIYEMVDARQLTLARMRTEELVRAKVAKLAGETKATELRASMLEAANREAVETARKAELKMKELEASGVVVSLLASTAQAAGTPALIAASAERLAPRDSGMQGATQGLSGRIAAAGIKYPDDPWRGEFGNSASNGGFEIKATNVAVGPENGSLDVTLVISPTTDAARATIDPGEFAVFFLHPVFGPEAKSATFSTDGTATMRFVTARPFTVGAVLEDGTTLELNLGEFEALPAEFLQR